MYTRIKTQSAYHYYVQIKNKWWHRWKTDSVYMYWAEAVNRESELIGTS